MTNPMHIVLRILAVMLLAGVLLMVWIYAGSPYMEILDDQNSKLVQSEKRLHSYQRLMAEEQTIAASLAALRELPSERLILLPDASSAIASANLRDLINRYIENTGAKLISSQSYGGDDLAGLELVGLRIHVSGEVEHLLDLLHSLETQHPYLFVEKLNVTALRQRENSRVQRLRSRRNPVSASQRASLDVRADVAGYIKKAL